MQIFKICIKQLAKFSFNAAENITSYINIYNLVDKKKKRKLKKNLHIPGITAVIYK